MEEEKVAEEFGKYAIRKYSGVYKSKLAEFIKEMFLDNKEIETVNENSEDYNMILSVYRVVNNKLKTYKKGSIPSTMPISSFNFTETGHWSQDREQRRENVERAGGLGVNIIARFVWDKKHKDGPELHYITDNAIIIAVNMRKQILQKRLDVITELVARPEQLMRYLKPSDHGNGMNILNLETASNPNWSYPPEVMEKAVEHQKAGLNHDENFEK